MHVCHAENETEARKTGDGGGAPNIAMGGQLGQDLALPAHYDAVAELVSEKDVAEVVPCGPDPDRHIAILIPFAYEKRKRTTKVRPYLLRQLRI